MIDTYSEEGNKSLSVDSANFGPVLARHGAAAGDTSNERLKVCYICKANGFPHEAIEFRKINNGRIRNDGSFEYQKYEVLNYFTGRKHEHRQMEDAI
jgi:hypothetical protein